MSSLAIKVENLSKIYRIGLKESIHDTFGGMLLSWVKSPVNNFRRLNRLSHFSENEEGKDVIWALKDINFEVKQGEVLGIIGRNGAGKSTLLKILSQITEPTTGKAEIYGRVASLLEVGTGFNPELTGRENIYLNGTILGMTRREINSKFDEIIDFSGVEKFLDTPVKRYSSGMRVRLAFAVAAHLEPEILIIDEVLAVGDAEFQKKCLGKMQEVSTNEGRTILFVSHNMTAIQSLCKKVMLLQEGRIKNIGSTEEIMNIYLSTTLVNKHEQLWEEHEMPGNEFIKVKAVSVKTTETGITRFDVTTPINILIDFWNLIPDNVINLSLVLKNLKGDYIFNVSTPPKKLSKGLHRAILHIPANLLNDDIYAIDNYFVKDSSTVLFLHREPVSFEIHDIPRENAFWYGKWVGAVRPKLNWEYYEIQTIN